MSYAVRTEGLGRRFGATDALSGLDLAVEPGTVLGLLGHNGAGKTTAVRILTTLLAPTSGRALVAGRDVAREPGAVRARIAVAGQEASLDERLTGRENLMLIGRLQRLSKREAMAPDGRAARALRHRARRRPPGRDLQRRHAPAARPRRVPDRRAARSCSSTSRRPASTPPPAPTCGARSPAWSTDGAALILTTQYLEEADRLADRIVVLSGGRTVAEGTPAELKRRVGDRRVHVTVDDFEEAARRLERLDPELDPRTRRLSVTAPGRPRRPARDPRRARRPRRRGGLAQPAHARRRVLRARRGDVR